MTGSDSLKEIEQLLLTYPGMESAVVLRVVAKQEVRIRFRCSDAVSIRSIASSSVWANVLITLGDPNISVGAEPRGVRELPYDIEIPDTETSCPTHVERFGVFISANLADRGLISEDRLEHLHSRWNAQLANRQRKPPTA